MLKKILIGLAALLVVLLIVIAVQPSEYRVSRTALLAGPPSALFEHVSDQRKFNQWNPWLKLDPNAKVEYTGAATGVGSVCSWHGDKNVGVGSATITESRPGELVRFRMDWKEPMSGTGTVDFTFKPDGDKTAVTWLMYGQNNFVGKAMCLVMNMDKMCGDQFERGLAALGDTVARLPAK
ncbi:MAG: SRPBCC family protein [Verrucomicrobiales bacterium]|nr:SRPBCC family protein [Verrucomicrobiales bacterium]